MAPRQELIEKLINKYESYIAPFTFVAGFILDTITLKRIDLWVDHLVILFYIFLVGGGITTLNLYESGRLRFRILDLTIQFIPVIIQFGFGGLFSAFVIFYSKSAAFSKSWLFLAVLIILLAGNERFRKRYQRLVFQLSIFFVALFSYCIFTLPILIGKMGAPVFLLSGAASLGLIILFILFLSFLTPGQIAESQRSLRFSILSIFIVFNGLYFTNIIPPVPLSLKESIVSHFVEKEEDGFFEVQFEPAPRYLVFREASSVFHWKRGERIYFFSSVFAPTELNVPILHRWSFYDEAEKKWTRQETFEFPITGGRDGGYRGYSFKTAVRPGKWRVEVLTERGETLGRETFTVVNTNTMPQLKIVFK